MRKKRQSLIRDILKEVLHRQSRTKNQQFKDGAVHRKRFLPVTDNFSVSIQVINHNCHLASHYLWLFHCFKLIGTLQVFEVYSTIFLPLAAVLARLHHSSIETSKTKTVFCYM